MRVPRFFIPVKDIDLQNKQISSGQIQLCKQIEKVLRLHIGDRVDFLDGQGSLYCCQITHLDKHGLKASIKENQQIEKLRLPFTNIALPLLKNGRFEWALEKLTEIGVAKISPVIFDRSVVKSDFGEEDQTRLETKMVRWQTISKEASEQCERGTIPQLVPPLPLLQFLTENANSKNTSLNIICSERSGASSLQMILGNHKALSANSQIVIIVGPEGGLTSQEIEAANASGFLCASLGDLILRSETAAIYALAVVASQISSSQK